MTDAIFSAGTSSTEHVSHNSSAVHTLLFALLQVTGLRPGEFIHTLGDAHVYVNHVEPLKQQLLNTPRHFPKLLVNSEKFSIDDFVAEDFALVDYNPHKPIKMQMAV